MAGTGFLKWVLNARLRLQSTVINISIHLKILFANRVFNPAAYKKVQKHLELMHETLHKCNDQVSTHLLDILLTFKTLDWFKFCTEHCTDFRKDNSRRTKQFGRIDLKNIVNVTECLWGDSCSSDMRGGESISLRSKDAWNIEIFQFYFLSQLFIEIFQVA